MLSPKKSKKCLCKKDHTNLGDELCPECSFAKGLSPEYWERWVSAGYKDPDAATVSVAAHIQKAKVERTCIGCKATFFLNSGRQEYCKPSCREETYKREGRYHR